MKTPTITRTNLELFCPACGRGLEMQENTRTVYDTETNKFLGFVLLCPRCGKALQTSEVGWRERKKEE